MAFFGNRRLLLASHWLDSMGWKRKGNRVAATVKIALFFHFFPFLGLPNNFFCLHLPSFARHYFTAAFFPYLRLLYTLNSSESAIMFVFSACSTIETRIYLQLEASHSDSVRSQLDCVQCTSRSRCQIPSSRRTHWGRTNLHQEEISVGRHLMDCYLAAHHLCTIQWSDPVFCKHTHRHKHMGKLL